MKGEIDYIIIGAQKAGTSWITDRFRELSDFEFMPIKEIHHFNRKYQDSISFPTKFKDRLKHKRWVKKVFIYLLVKIFKTGFSFSWIINLLFKDYDDEWYINFFKPMKKIKGDNTPCYSILHLEDIQKMKLLAPNAKIIFCLRNPIDRIWSSYRFDLTHKFTKKNDGETEMQFFERIALGNFSKDRTNYLETIKRYKSVYGENQMLVTYYDKLKENPKEFLTEIVDFVGGDSANIEKIKGLNNVSNKSVKTDIPEEYHSKIIKLYRPMMKEMSNKFGSYPKIWYSKLEK